MDPAENSNQGKGSRIDLQPQPSGAIIDAFHHTIPDKSFIREKPLMSHAETEEISRAWDYLVGHVGIKVGFGEGIVHYIQYSTVCRCSTYITN